ncbi:Protein O-linked-mannose beta-1,2-N-acetylglucosaminyltransferase 1 [Orchesella cincta]|uniref:Protein O-linked-mannose beta-1,2-N-acetylglucosaminyltransferase 1 n=1 Tax=Orchesella cincta TaxID=48709 RepID=A0A1D2N0X3_ORCCI|nr:Protein O-linked-mannose beta-1,2-N-acetylglucosaminyltransferase 1 [Orchesella cincta]
MVLSCFDASISDTPSSFFDVTNKRLMSQPKVFQNMGLGCRVEYHKGMWRIHSKSNQLFVVGVPFSPYSNFKPSNVTPIYLDSELQQAKDVRGY